jgi:hypothetical protein
MYNGTSRHTCDPETRGTLNHYHGECMACGERNCPHGEPLHYHHDGCPACWFANLEEPTNRPTQIQENN